MKRGLAAVLLSLCPAFAWGDGGATFPLTTLSQAPNSPVFGGSLIPSDIRAVDALAYPAYAGFADRKSVTLADSVLTGGGNYNSIGLAYPTMQRGTWVVGLYRLQSGSAQERDAFGNVTGSFTDQQTLLRLAYGDHILPHLTWGANFDYFGHTLAGATTSSLSGSMGLQYRDDRYSAGVSGDNLVQTTSGQTSDQLPAQARVNAGVKLFDRLHLGLEALVIPTLDLRAGIEYFLLDNFSVRLGDGEGGIATGIGVKYRDYQLDYNMTIQSLGLSQQIGLSAFFGASRAAQHAARAEELYLEARRQAIDGRYAAAAKMMTEAGRYGALPLERRTFLESLQNLVKAGVNELGDTDELQAELRKGVGYYLEDKPSLARVMFLTVQAKDPENSMVKSLISLVSRPEDLPSPPSFVDVDPIKLKLFKIDEYFQKHQLDLALKECREIIALDPGSVIGYVRLGSIYYALGIKGAAVKAWNYAAELAPTDPDVIKALRFMREEKVGGPDDAGNAVPLPAPTKGAQGEKK